MNFLLSSIVEVLAKERTLNQGKKFLTAVKSRGWTKIRLTTLEIRRTTFVESILEKIISSVQ